MIRDDEIGGLLNGKRNYYIKLSNREVSIKTASGDSNNEDNGFFDQDNNQNEGGGGGMTWIGSGKNAVSSPPPESQ